MLTHPSIRNLLGFQPLKLTSKHFQTGNFIVDATGSQQTFSRCGKTDFK
jgi:hypothetical protein